MLHLITFQETDNSNLHQREQTLLPRTVLTRARDIQLTIEAPDRVVVRFPDGELVCPAEALTILDVFSYPLTFAEGLAELKKRVMSALHWIELTQLVLDFHRIGILLDDSGKRPAFDQEPTFGAPYIHVRMLNDRSRTEAYLKAIQEVVMPGDVVLDLGTGTGILAVAAAKRGARRVYAIEATSIGAAADKLFEANGFSDRISLVSGWSTQIALPERVDVMVSEIIGDAPFGERVRDLTWDARRRFLKPDARIIPHSLRVMAQAVRVPADFVREHRFEPEDIANWRDWYGIDFSSLCAERMDVASYAFVDPCLARGWSRIGNAVILADVEMRSVNWEPIETVSRSVVSADCELNAVVEYFEVGLSASTWFSDSPWIADKDCSWRVCVWLMPHPLKLKEGEVFEIFYRHCVPGKPDIVEVRKRDDVGKIA